MAETTRKPWRVGEYWYRHDTRCWYRIVEPDGSSRYIEDDKVPAAVRNSPMTDAVLGAPKLN